jgi:hypothetical protein
MGDFFLFVNSFAWVAGSILVAYIAVAIVVFVIGYYVLFDPGATTAGKLIFRFMLSLVGVIILVFIGTYIDPSPNREWSFLPPDVTSWRPLLRFLIYGYVAFTITSLGVLLALRKWKPNRIKSAPDINLVKLRHTNDIPTVTEK